MSSLKIQCHNCKATFYNKNQILCETCETAFCPNCSSCDCTRNIQYKKIHTITTDKINTVHESDLLELNGTLSPLIGQEPVQTKQGKILKTEFEFSDENGKIPITVWGPVPETIFPMRYEYIRNITFQGVKKKIIKGKPVINILKSTKIFINSFKTRSLEYFLSEA